MSNGDFTLTSDYLKSILSYDKLTGDFFWKKTGKKAGGKCVQGYMRIKIHGKTYKSHRLAFIHELGDFDFYMVDHINGKRDDNKFSNLRIIDNSGNQLNRVSPNINNSSGFLGVNFNQEAGKYAARIQVNGKRVHLGHFSSPEEASKAYNSAKSAMTKSINLERQL